jgi:hypothetical protein
MYTHIHYFSKSLIFLLFTCLALSGMSQNADSTLSKFLNYHQQSPAEKVYLHTDKEVFAQNETLWFSAYLVDAVSHLPIELSTLVYVELLSPTDSLIISLPIRMTESMGSGEIFLPDSLGEGTYTLRAYTHYMRNFNSDYFYSKPIKLLKYSDQEMAKTKPTPDVDTDIQLFPEGGYLISGIPNVVAFRITNERGLGLAMNGKLLDKDGEVITEFVPSQFGMGKFQFTPESGLKYFVSFEKNGVEITKSLSKSRDKGYQLSIRQNTKKTYITVKATPGLSMDNCYVVGHVRGQIVIVLAAVEGKPFIYSGIPNDQIPAGIMHITFFKNDEPLLERLVYIENQSQMVAVEGQVTAGLKKRDKAEVEITLPGMDSLAIGGNISVAILKAADPVNEVNIENFLLLTSDLSGTIENPSFYSDKQNEKRFQAMDLLMLTHGWRRFEWSDVLDDQLPAVRYFPEKGFTIEGKVVKYENRKKPVEIDLVLTFVENMAFRINTTSQSDGTFWFEGLPIDDSLTAVVQTIRKKQKKESEIQKDLTTFIQLKDKTYPKSNRKFPGVFGTKEKYEEYVDLMLEIAQISAAFDDKVIILEEMEVTANREKRQVDPLYRESQLYKVPDSRIVLDSIPGMERFTNMFQLLNGRVAGVVILGSPPNQTAMIRGFKSIQGSSEALFVVDGLPTDASLISSINPQTISHIDILKGNKGSIYGTYNGVIALYTRDGTSVGVTGPPRGFQTFQHFGYHQPKEFYIPKYDIMTAEEKVKPDRRSTQYWNPGIEIKDGKASFSYFTSDDTGDFIIYVEGLTKDGNIIRSTIDFRVD